jgi:short-subunit dehydrogenase
MKLDRACVVLTGAASGIGREVLRLLALYQMQVIAVDVDAALLAEVCEELATGLARIIPFVCDLSSFQAVDDLFTYTLSQVGGVDLFIANAGFAYYEEILQPDWKHIECIFQVNVFTPLYILEKMQALYAGQPYKVVITTSAMAHIGVPGYAFYSATKAALDRFADVYRWQMDDPGKLMLVYPIGTRTNFFKTAGEGTPYSWPTQSPKTVAQAILRGIRHDRQSVYSSSIFSLVLLINRIFPPLRWLVQYLEQRRFIHWKISRK